MSNENKSWPEFVGKDADEVKSELTAEGYQVEIKPDGAPTTRDFRLNRVRLFVDDNNVIVKEPRTG